MSYELRPGQWNLFRNERKSTDSQPDFTGTINLDGREYTLAAWTRESGSGRKYFSGQVKPKEERR